MGLFDSFKKKDEAPKGLPPEDSPTQIIQDMPELPSMPQENKEQEPNPLEHENPVPENPDLEGVKEVDQASFEVPDFTDDELDFGPDDSVPEQTSPESEFEPQQPPEPEPQPEESLEDLPLFNIKPKPQIKPVAKPVTVSSLKQEVFSDESVELPEIFIEKRQYGRVLLAEERLLTSSKELQEFIGNVYGFIKEEKAVSESLSNDFLTIQKELMSIDTELFEKEDQK